MTELSRSSASRSLWAKPNPKAKLSGRPQRKEPGVVLPVLSRGSSGRRTSSYDTIDNLTRGTSLKALLASQLDGNDREPYSRSQLRAMASSKLQSTKNNNNSPSHPKPHHKVTVKTEAGDRLTLTPLAPASLAQSKTQRQAVPKSIQSAINEVLAGRTTDRQLSDRDGSDRDRGNNNFDEDCTPEIPRHKDITTCKVHVPNQRPEWRKYIRRIMMAKSLKGTTLARYRRLVGIVARKNLAKSFDGAAERVVQYRLEFRSAVIVQQMVHRFLKRRRHAKAFQQHQAALTIQHAWTMAAELKKKKKLKEEVRQAEIVRLACLGAAITIQRAFRRYQLACHQRQEQLCKQQEEKVLETARLKLLNKYQSWRRRSKNVAPHQEPTYNASNAAISAEDNVTCGERIISHELHEPVEVPVATLADAVPCTSVIECNEVVGIAAPCIQPSISSVEPDSNIDSPVASVPPLPLHSVSFDSPAAATQQSDQNFKKSVDMISATSYVDGQNYSAEANVPDLTVRGHEDIVKIPTMKCDHTAVPSSSSLTCQPAPEDDSSGTDDTADTRELDVNQTFSEENELQERDDSQETKAQDAITKAAATTISRVLLLKVETKRKVRVEAAQKIARILLRAADARQTTRMHASIIIQCWVRSYQAQQLLVQRRLDVLQSLRTQLLAGWNLPANQSPALPTETTGKCLESDDENEEEDFDFEFDGDVAARSVPDSYLHLLPTRNGQIPPGVPLLKCNGGAPVLPLWKWSWPKEKWISNGQ